MKSTKYPKDWYRYLKKGDIVECVNVKLHANLDNRKVGSKLNVLKYNGEIVYENIRNEECYSKEYNDFIPIKMQAFPDLNQESEVCYEIY